MKRLVLALLPLILAPSSLSARSVQWGINGHTISHDSYKETPVDAQLDLVKESGVSWYRLSLYIETYRRNTERFDELLEKAEARGLKLLPILMPSGLRDEKRTPEQIREASHAFGKEMAERYKGRITHWELANELDHFALIRKDEVMPSGKKWTQDNSPDGSSPDHYETTRYERSREAIRALHEGVKAGDPSAKTMVDTCGWFHYGFIERLKQDGAADFDILAWHWYSDMGDITAVSGRKTNVLQLLIDRYRKPNWLTEIGRKNGSRGGKEQEQADYISGPVAALAKHPGVEAIFIYELLEQPYFNGSGEAFYGLVTVRKENGKWTPDRKKPGFGALKKVTREE